MLDVLVFLASFAGIIYLSTHISRSAESIARRLGETIGALVLTLSGVAFQVLLLAILMSDGNHMSLARDTIYSAVMLQVGGVLGFGLLVVGYRKADQRFNRQNSNTYLAALVVALMLPMVSPAYVPEYIRNQWAVFSALVLLLIYASFLLMRAARQKPFLEYRTANASSSWEAAPMWQPASVMVGLMIIAGVLAVLMSRVMDNATAVLGLPYSVVGAFVAAAATAPEVKVAIRGILHNHLPTAVNVAIGGALAGVLLTVPLMMLASKIMGFDLVLELTGIQITLLAASIVTAFMVTQEGEANVLGGSVLLGLFLVFLFHSFFI